MAKIPYNLVKMIFDNQIMEVPITRRLRYDDTLYDQSERVAQHISPRSQNNNNGTSQLPQTLFEICIEYVAKNIHLVDSFCGFPEIVGFKLFQTAQRMKKFRHPTMETLQSLRLFCLAYESEVISCLDLSASHLGIAEYLDQLCLFMHLSELDVGQCGLGDDHELLQHIGHLTRLTKLGVCENALSDKAIQKLTTPLRMFKRGPGGLQELDLSGNEGITCRVSRFLKCFPALSYVNLSATSVTNAHRQTLELDLNLRFVKESSKKWSKTKNEGWAAGVVSDWMNQTSRPPALKKILSQCSKFYTKKAKLFCTPNKGADELSQQKKMTTQFYLVRKESAEEKTSETSVRDSRLQKSCQKVAKPVATPGSNQSKQCEGKNITDDIIGLYISQGSSTESNPSVPTL